MKPPEEIKKGLEGCGVLDGDCENCPYDDGPQLLCVDRLRKDALAYIQQLEAGIDHAEKVARECAKSITENLDKLEFRLAQVERERDALLDYLGDSTCAPCDICKHDVGSGVMGCKRIREIGIPCFEWRGVCEENMEEG